MLQQISWEVCAVKWGRDSSEKDEVETLKKQRKSWSEQIIDVQAGTCWVESCLLSRHTQLQLSFVFFSGVWSSHFQWKIVILILDWKMGGTKQQDPKVFACVTICIFVMSWIFLCRSWMNCSMASGLWLYQLIINHVSIRFICMFCSICMPANMAGD